MTKQEVKNAKKQYDRYISEELKSINNDIQKLEKELEIAKATRETILRIGETGGDLFDFLLVDKRKPKPSDKEAIKKLLEGK